MLAEPLFAVRVISDSPSIIAQTLPIAVTIIGVAVGGWATYLATIKTEKRKFDDETKHLAMSIAVEVRAAIDIFNKTISIFEKLSYSFHADTIRYSDPLDEPLPITRSAAAKVGRFTPEVAELIAKLLVHLASIQQGNKIIRAMAKAEVLTDERFADREAALLPIIEDMRKFGEELIVAIFKTYDGGPAK